MPSHSINAGVRSDSCNGSAIQPPTVPSTLRRKLKQIALCVIGFCLMVSTSIARPTEQLLDKNNRVQPTQTAAAADAAGLAPIKVNIELESIYNISIKDNSYMADGYLTIHFPERLAAGEAINPERPCFTFENDLESNQYTTLRPRESTTINKDDPTQRHKYAYDFSGKFAMGDKHQHRYNPFGTLNLQIMLSPTCGLDYSKQKAAVALEDFISPTNSGEALVTNLELPIGYNIRQASMQAQVRQWPRSSYSWMVANLTIATSNQAAFLRWMVPLLVIIGIVIGAPSLNSEYFEARIGIPSASLLTLVIMHQSYRSDLPNFPYLTYLDKIFVFSYVMCLAMFILLALDSSNRWSDRPILKIGLPNNKLVALSFEQIVQGLSLIGLVLVATLSWLI